MKELIVLIGPAQSGKSTYIENNYDSGYVRISADEIRFGILNPKITGVYFDPSIESKVWNTVWKLYETALLIDDRIIFDATNLTFQRRYPIVARARKQGYHITFVWFIVRIETLFARDRMRKRKVGKDIIMRQWLALKKPEKWEYDELIKVKY